MDGQTTITNHIAVIRKIKDEDLPVSGLGVLTGARRAIRRWLNHRSRATFNRFLSNCPLSPASFFEDALAHSGRQPRYLDGGRVREYIWDRNLLIRVWRTTVVNQ